MAFSLFARYMWDFLLEIAPKERVVARLMHVFSVLCRTPEVCAEAVISVSAVFYFPAFMNLPATAPSCVILGRDRVSLPCTGHPPTW